MKFMSIKTKLIILCLFLLVIPITVISISTQSMAKNQLNALGAEDLKQHTVMVKGMIRLLDAEVKNGHLSINEAQEKLRVELLGERVDERYRAGGDRYKIKKSGYLWAINQSGKSVMSSVDEGMDLTKVTTNDGVNIGKTALKTAKKGGYYTFQMENPSTKKVETSLVYVETDPIWGWIIGAQTFESEFNAGANQLTIIISIISIVGIIVGAVIAYIYAAKFTKPILKISEKLKYAAQGDFSGEELEATSKDEIGALTKDYNEMSKSMRSLISQFSNSTEHVASSTKKLNDSAEDTSRATHEINDAIQEVAARSKSSTIQLQETAVALEEVTTAINTLADTSSSISEASTSITKQASEGNAYVEKTVMQINSINQKVLESNEVLSLLDMSSNKIGEITDVINEIANQTNLLALNAAIEAARAGEHGKGFAVVADEVRRLAEQSQSSSQQIYELIRDIQANMSRSTQAMSSVKVEVQEGLSIVAQTETSFKGIVENMSRVRETITDMAATVEELSASAEEVSASVNTVSSLAEDAATHTQAVAANTEQQLAAIEDISASSTTLSDLALELKNQVKSFKI